MSENGNGPHDHDHDHDHHGHDHDHRGHDHHGHEGHGDDEPDISAWAATTQKLTCPACGAAGAVTLGGGTFCPTCGAVSTNAGYQAPAEPEA